MPCVSATTAVRLFVVPRELPDHNCGVGPTAASELGSAVTTGATGSASTGVDAGSVLTHRLDRESLSTLRWARSP
jgi:hypothetical protein